MTTNAEQNDYRIFENRQIQILLNKHENTEEAHNAKLTTLDCKIVGNEIFTSLPVGRSLVDSLQELTGNNEVVTCSVITRIMDKCSSGFCNDDMVQKSVQLLMKLWPQST